MKNKSGFTLVELLGVITILAALALIAVPTVDNIITKNREKMYQSQITAIKNSLKSWGDAYADFLPEDGDDALLLNLGTLKAMGFVNEDIRNPKTNLCFSNDMLLSISAVKQGYTYYVDEESGLDGTEDDCSMSVSNDLLYLLGNDIIELLGGDQYNEPGFLAIDINGELDNSSVTQIIKDKDGNVVTSIDTSLNTKSPYTVSYTYGETVLARTVNVLIGDPVGTKYLFNYTGNVQQQYLYPGTYKIELWGATGGGTTDATKGVSLGGRGAYVSGNITLLTGTNIYVYVGQSGGTFTTSNIDDSTLYTTRWNGGGAGAKDTSESVNTGEHGFPGGGATDIRLVSGNYEDSASLVSRIIVASGGGGGGWSGNGSSDQYYAGGGGAGGTLSGINPTGAVTFTVGTQISGSAFGLGGNGVFGGVPNNNGTGGGGGGYYGGKQGINFTKPNSSGSGGSSFISGFSGCNAVNSSGVSTGQPNHYSALIFTDSQMIDGNTSMPTYDGSGTMTGNSNNGYAKITKIA